MIFTKNGRNILKEWVLAIKNSSIQSTNANLIPALKKAASGDNCKTTFISSIAALSHSRISNKAAPPEMHREARQISDEIMQHYKIKMSGAILTVIKKGF